MPKPQAALDRFARKRRERRPEGVID